MSYPEQAVMKTPDFMYYVSTNREQYGVTKEGYITRHGKNLFPPSNGWIPPSKQWSFLGIVSYNNNGTVKEFISFSALPEKLDYFRENRIYGNGKQKWHVVDFDHGTRRHWGETLSDIRAA